MEVDVEEALNRAGGFGWFQLRIFIMFQIFHSIQPMHAIVNTFVGRSPVWNCANALSISTEEEKCQFLRYNSCEVTYSDDYTSIVSEWNLICGLSHLPALSQSALFIGILLGSWFSGLLSDRFGRRKVCVYLTMLLPLVALISGLAPSYSVYALSRFMIGVCSAGHMTFYVLFIEIVGQKYRSLITTVSTASFGIGYLFLAVAVYFIPRWREFTVFTAAITLVTVPFFCRLLPESPRWLVVHNRERKARLLLMSIARTNGRVMSEFTLKTISGEEQSNSAGVFDIYYHPVMRQRAGRLICCWFSCCMMYYTLSMGVGDLGGNLFISFSLSGLVEAFSSLPSEFLLGRIGRKGSTAGCLLIGGLACLACAFVLYSSEDENFDVLKISLYLLGKVSVSIAFIAVYVFTNELFPTELRTTGFGLCNIGARIGGILSPLVLLLDHSVLGSSMFLMGVVGLVTAFLSLPLPETLNTPLPRVLKDIH